jgi:hypothetical protein
MFMSLTSLKSERLQDETFWRQRRRPALMKICSLDETLLVGMNRHGHEYIIKYISHTIPKVG